MQYCATPHWQNSLRKTKALNLDNRITVTEAQTPTTQTPWMTWSRAWSWIQSTSRLAWLDVLGKNVFFACITKLSLLCWWALPHINNQRSSPVAVIQQHTAAYHLWSFQSPSSPNQVTRSWRKSMHWGSVQFWAAGSVQAWARLGQLHTMASEAHRRPLWTLDFLYFRFARSSNQNQNRDEVGIYFQCSCIAYPSLGCYSKRLDGKIVRSCFFVFSLPLWQRFHRPVLRSCGSVWQRAGAGPTAQRA